MREGKDSLFRLNKDCKMQCANSVKLKHKIVEKFKYCCYIVDNTVKAVENPTLNVNYTSKIPAQQEYYCAKRKC